MTSYPERYNIEITTEEEMREKRENDAGFAVSDDWLKHTKKHQLMFLLKAVDIII